MIWLLVFGTVIIATTIIFIVKKLFLKTNGDDDGAGQVKLDRQQSKDSVSGETTKKSSKVDHRKKVQTTFTHPWLATNLKGHSGQILGDIL